MGLVSTKLTGGEPFLRTDINDILMLIHTLGISIQIETNGTLITKENVLILKEIQRRDRQFFISVSLDGEEKNHDKQRGIKGCFRKTLNGIDLLSREKIPVQIIFSVQKANAGDLKSVVQLCKERLVHSIKVNFINDIERGKHLKKNSQLLSLKEILELNKAISLLSSRYDLKIITNLPPVFKPIPDFMRCGKCGIFGIMGILSDGSVSICGIGTSVSELVVGNIKSDSLADLWIKAPLFQEIRQSIPHELRGICGQCMLKAYCLGQCRADAYYKTHDLLAPFELCQHAYDQGLFPKKWLIPK